MKAESSIREPLIVGHKNYHQVSEDIIRPIEDKPSKEWLICITISALVMMFGLFSLAWTVWYGIG